MKLLFGVLLSTCYCLLGIFFIFLLTISFVITRENTRQTLHTVRFYNHIIMYMQKSWLQEYEESNPSMKELLITHTEKIITPNWVEYIGDMLINEGFGVMESQKTFRDISVDLRLLKQNYSITFSDTPYKEQFSDTLAQIPDFIPLTKLFHLTEQDLEHTSLQLRGVITTGKVLLMVLGILLCLITIFFFLIFSKSQAVTWIAANFIVTGTLFLIFPLLFHVIVLSSIFSQWIQEINSSWVRLLVLIVLALFEKIVRMASLVGVGVFGSGFATLVMLFHVKRR